MRALFLNGSRLTGDADHLQPIGAIVGLQLGQTRDDRLAVGAGVIPEIEQRQTSAMVPLVFPGPTVDVIERQIVQRVAVQTTRGNVSRHIR